MSRVDAVAPICRIKSLNKRIFMCCRIVGGYFFYFCDSSYIDDSLIVGCTSGHLLFYQLGLMECYIICFYLFYMNF
jgi:hypothetical protein